jgi:uncharacterized membrane protein
VKLVWILSAGALTACAASRPPEAQGTRCDGTGPTFVASARPVLERRCFACHANGGPAADEHDFTRAESVWAQRQSIADNVSSHAMPPAHSPPLSEAETQALLRWVACGSP